MKTKKSIQGIELSQQWCTSIKIQKFLKYVSDKSLRALQNNSRLHLCIQISQLHHTENSAYYDWLHENIQCNGWNWKAL